MVMASISQAQITLEQTYPDGDTKLYMVDLEISGIKYLLKSDVQGNRFLKFYNLDHSLWKTIDCNSFPTTNDPMGEAVYNFDALYISETLFDCDERIEFLYVSHSGIQRFTGIYNEEGTSLIEMDNCAPLVKINIPQQFRPIYNTPDGTKLILSHTNGSALVYSLPCSLATGIDLFQSEDFSGNLTVFPNPSIDQTTINYRLPNDTKEAEILISDMVGNEIKRYRVDSYFSNLTIPKKEIPSGTYIYSLISDGNVIDSKKIIIE